LRKMAISRLGPLVAMAGSSESRAAPSREDRGDARRGVAQPCASLAAAGYGLMHVVPPGTIGGTLCSQLRWANLVVGVFNLLPGLPLDGGRMLRAVIWKLSGRQSMATIAAAWSGVSSKPKLAAKAS